MKGFNASFRIRHPSLDLSEFLKPIGITPSFFWKNGDNRSTPKGVLLEGIRDHSYCCYRLPLLAEDLAEWFENALYLLNPMSEKLISLDDAGGRLEFYIGFEKGVFSGAEINHKLLKKLAGLRISLSIDQDF